MIEIIEMIFGFLDIIAYILIVFFIILISFILIGLAHIIILFKKSFCAIQKSSPKKKLFFTKSMGRVLSAAQEVKVLSANAQKYEEYSEEYQQENKLKDTNDNIETWSRPWPYNDPDFNYSDFYSRGFNNSFGGRR